MNPKCYGHPNSEFIQKNKKNKKKHHGPSIENFKSNYIYNRSKAEKSNCKQSLLSNYNIHLIHAAIKTIYEGFKNYLTEWVPQASKKNHHLNSKKNKLHSCFSHYFCRVSKIRNKMLIDNNSNGVQKIQHRKNLIEPKL